MGWGMHSTMNTVDIFAFGRGTIRVTDNDVRQMIWFFDEILGHLLIYAGFYGLMFQFCLIEKGMSNAPVKRETLMIALFGAAWGVGMAGGIIESGFTLVILPINILSISFILHLLNKSGERAKMFLQKHPFILFYSIQTLTVIPLITAYFILFGLTQPSEILKPILIELYGN